MWYLYINYLFSCDYVYKKNYIEFNLKNPIENISLSISLNNFKKEIDPFNIFNDTVDVSQLKLFFIFYITFFLQPFIKCLNIKDVNYVIKLIFSKNRFKIFFKLYPDFFYSIFNYLIAVKSVSPKINIIFSSDIFNTFFAKQTLKSVFSINSLKTITVFFSSISK
jgi:hypothetical protein